jgi:membrane fusion protein PltH
MRSRIILGCILLAAILAAVWWFTHRRLATDDLILTGNVDLRQVTLAFNGSERIEAVLVEEGAVVRKDQILARMETGRLAPQVAQAEAQVSAQQASLDRLRNGNRPEEIAQGRANHESAKADALNAERQLERQTALLKSAITSQQAYDQAKAAADTARAKVDVQQKAVDLLIAGPRIEDIALAEAQLRASEAQLTLLRKQLADVELKSPVDAVVRSRLMEPGEMASPTRPVFSLALADPKWVRTYVSETRLGQVRPGMHARVTIDSFPGKSLEGWVGFISPVAEFTPKTVQTEDLRTSLVYEVRVYTKDPDNVLRLGVPATVRLLADAAAAAAAERPK